MISQTQSSLAAWNLYVHDTKIFLSFSSKDVDLSLERYSEDLRHDFIMIKKCCGNDVAAFAKLSHVTLYARTATDGNMSKKGFFAVATYWR